MEKTLFAWSLASRFKSISGMIDTGQSSRTVAGSMSHSFRCAFKYIQAGNAAFIHLGFV